MNHLRFIFGVLAVLVPLIACEPGGGVNKNTAKDLSEGLIRLQQIRDHGMSISGTPPSDLHPLDIPDACRPPLKVSASTTKHTQSLPTKPSDEPFEPFRDKLCPCAGVNPDREMIELRGWLVEAPGGCNNPGDHDVSYEL